MNLYNVLWPDGTAINRNPVNAVQARTMVKIFKLNYGFTPTIQEL